jgi:hypothetical protein
MKDVVAIAKDLMGERFAMEAQAEAYATRRTKSLCRQASGVWSAFWIGAQAGMPVLLEENGEEKAHDEEGVVVAT